MAKNKDKVLRDAEKLVRKNKVEDAIELYEKVLKSNPNDPNLLNRIGDLYGQLGQVDRAVELYLRIADHFAEDGFVSKAIAILKKINRAAPDRLDVFERLAELYLRQGLVVEAKSQLERLAGWHRENGRLDESVRVHQRLLQIDPDNHVVHLRLADLLMEQGNEDEALEVYDRLGTMLLGHDRLDEADRLYQHVLEAGPESGTVFVPIVEALTAAGRYPRAREFCDAAWKLNPGNRDLAIPRIKILTSVGEGKAAVDLAEKTLEKHGEDLDVRAAAGRALLAVGEGARAKELLLFSFDEMLDRGELEPARNLARDLIKALPKDAEVLERAVRAFQSSGDGEMLHTLRAALADACFRVRRSNEARDLYLELSRERPDEPLYQDRLRALAAGGGVIEEPAEEAEPAAPVEAVQPAAAVEQREEAKEVAAPEFDPDERFAEANVFAKYGLMEKALQHLEGIVEAFPEYHPAREKFVLLLVEQGKTEQARGFGGPLREHYREIGAEDRLVALNSSLGESDLGAPEESHASKAAGRGAEAVDAGELDESEDELLILDLDAEEAAGEVEEPVIESVAEQAIAEASAEAPGVGAEEEPAAQTVEFAGSESVEAADESVSSDEAVDREKLAAELQAEAGPPPEVSVEEVDALLDSAGIDVGPRSRPQSDHAPSGESAAAEVEPEGEREQGPSTEAEAPALVEEPSDRIEVEPPSSADGAEVVGASDDAAELIELDDVVDGPLLNELEQVDFFIAQGLYEDAIRMLDSLEEEHAGHEELAQRRLELKKRGFLLEEVEEGSGEAMEELFSEEDEYVDLAHELEQEFAEEERMVSEATGEGQDEALLEEVFQEFQKGVAEQLSEEDSDTHFNLGIAYKEMGLLPEAIREFQIADNNPEYRTESCSMIAMCYLEQGLPGEAVQWYRRAIDGPDLTGSSRLGVLYDLASALEQAGDLEEAGASLEEIAAVDPSFRDVETRLQSLEQQRQAN